MSRLPYLRRDELTPGGQEVRDSIVGSRGAALVTDQGALTGLFNAFVHAPDVGRHLTALGQVLRIETSIERRLSELAIITVGGPLESRVRMVGPTTRGWDEQAG